MSAKIISLSMRRRIFGGQLGYYMSARSMAGQNEMQKKAIENQIDSKRKKAKARDSLYLRAVPNANKTVESSAADDFELKPRQFTNHFECRAYSLGNSIDIPKIIPRLHKVLLSAQTFEGGVHLEYREEPEILDLLNLEQVAVTNSNIALQTKHESPQDILYDSKGENTQGTSNKKHIFFFADGSLVFWGTSILEEKKWVEWLKPHIASHSLPGARIISEKFQVQEGMDDDTQVKLNGIFLKMQENDDERVKELLAFSSSISRSLKLEVFEGLMEELLRKIKIVPEKLGNDRLISTAEWRNVMAELLRLRSALNLHSELLETPDIYWEEPKLEMLFDRMEQHLDVAKRINVLNKRLDYSQQVYDCIRDYQHEESSMKVERIIMVLIAIEIGFELMNKSEWWRSFRWESLFHEKHVE